MLPKKTEIKNSIIHILVTEGGLPVSKATKECSTIFDMIDECCEEKVSVDTKTPSLFDVKVCKYCEATFTNSMEMLEHQDKCSQGV